MTARRIGSLVLAAGMLLPAIGSAQQTVNYPPCNRTPTESDVAAAKGAFQAGKVSFDEAEYSRAIDYWEDAYRRDCTATGLLLNLSRAYELNGNLYNAIASLREYLERNPDTPQRAQLERRITFLEERLKSAPPVVSPPPPGGETNANATDNNGAAPTNSDTPPPVTPTVASPSERPTWPLFVAGGGAVVAIVGSILYLDARSDVSHYEDLCSGREGCPNDTVASDANDASSSATMFGVITLGGLAILGGGVAWYFLAPPTEGASASGIELGESVAFTPLAGPTFAGMELQGHF